MAGRLRPAALDLNSAHGRWRLTLLLFIVTVCNYLNRQIFSFVAPAISTELHLTNSGIATIINAFLIAYTIGQLAAGGYVDRIGVRKAFALAAALWSIATMLTCIARGVWSFSFFRFFLGAAESFNFPAGVKVVAEWFPPEERSTSIGIFSGGSSIGALIAPPVVVYLIVHFGWRSAFLGLGFPGLLWAAVWLYVYPLPGVRPALADCNATRPERQSLPWAALLRNRSLGAVFGARFLEEPVSWFYFTWLAVYLKTLRAVPLADIGTLLIAPFLTLDFGYIAGGWVASRLIRNGMTVIGARRNVLLASAFCMLSSIPAVYAATSFQFVLWISLATFGHGSWGANIFALPADLAPAHSAGRAYGLTAFGGGIGSILFIQMVGFLVDVHKSFNLVFIIAGILPMAAALLLSGVLRERPLLTLSP